LRTTLIPRERWRECVAVLLRDGVVAIPTDTVYGVAALPSSRAAIETIYEAKGRPADKALPVLVSEPRFAEAVGRFSARLSRACAAHWPGALTVVVPARSGFVSPALNEDGTVGLRMPADPLALAIIAAAGGILAVTSANRSGSPPATTAAGVMDQLGGLIDAVVDGGPSPGGTASTVIRLTRGRLQVLREGAIEPSDIRRAMMPPRAPGT
jgi:L-threonylcarbamoyladenylate synthase